MNPDIPDGCTIREPWDSTPTWRGQTCLALVHETDDGNEEYYGWGQLSGGEDWRDMDPTEVRAEQEAQRDDMLTAALDAYSAVHGVS